jgi:hypothetical protein
MKKHLLITILFFAMTITVFGQTHVDSVEVYSCNIQINRSGEEIDYFVNGKKSNEEVINKIYESKQKVDSFEVCYITYIDIHGTKISSGLYYPKCNQSSEKSTKTEVGYYSKTVNIKSQGCKDGKWILYNSKGRKKRKAEYYDKGKKIKE